MGGVGPSGATGESNGPVRLLLVDDHELLLDSLRQALDAQDDFHVVGRAANVADALTVGVACDPDIVVLDLRLDGEDAVGSIMRFTHLPSRPKVVILSAARDRRNAARALEAGASGYLTKQQPLSELLAGLRGVIRGRAALDPSLLGGVLHEMAHDDPSRLTERELDVLRLLAQGHDARQIGDQLTIATNTVRNHVQRILTKLSVGSRLAAVARARELGLLDE